MSFKLDFAFKDCVLDLIGELKTPDRLHAVGFIFTVDGED